MPGDEYVWKVLYSSQWRCCCISSSLVINQAHWWWSPSCRLCTERCGATSWPLRSNMMTMKLTSGPWRICAFSCGEALRLPLALQSWFCSAPCWSSGSCLWFCSTSWCSFSTPGSCSGWATLPSPRTSRRHWPGWEPPSCSACSPSSTLASTCSAGQPCRWSSTTQISLTNP